VRAKFLISTFSLFLFLSGLLFATRASAQTHQSQPQRIDPTMNSPEADAGRERVVRDMAKKANQERQAALKKDTEKLVQLTGELKDYVDKSNENMLSLDVVKKAEEIEKLAKSVREKMRGVN
jgi:hypothetical protein